MTRHRRFLLFIAMVVLAAPAWADLWTNQAGRVIEARLDKFDGQYVTLVRSNAAPLRIPLSALCATDQRRVRIQSAQSIAPDFVKAAYQDALSVLLKFEKLPPHQQTAETRARAVNMACAIYDGRIKARSAELTDKEILAEVRRLRASLSGKQKDVP